MQRRRGFFQRIVSTWNSGWTGKLGLGCGVLAVVMLCSIGCVALILVIPTPEETSGSPTSPTSEPTVALPPTSTPQSGATAVPATATPTLVPPTVTPTPEPLVLKGKAFEADTEETCSTDVAITEVVGEGLRIEVLSGSLSIREGGLTIWCYGAKHTWIGTLTYGGHTFVSDEENPLQFTLDEDRGYVYLAGEGSIELPDGSVVDLPQ